MYAGPVSITACQRYDKHALVPREASQEDGGTDDVRSDDLHAERVLSCEVCGTVGERKWVCNRRAAEVVELGGFGLTATPQAVERTWTG